MKTEIRAGQLWRWPIQFSSSVSDVLLVIACHGRNDKGFVIWELAETLPDGVSTSLYPEQAIRGWICDGLIEKVSDD